MSIKQDDVHMCLEAVEKINGKMTIMVIMVEMTLVMLMLGSGDGDGDSDGNTGGVGGDNVAVVEVITNGGGENSRNSVIAGEVLMAVITAMVLMVAVMVVIGAVCDDVEC